IEDWGGVSGLIVEDCRFRGQVECFCIIDGTVDFLEILKLHECRINVKNNSSAPAVELNSST
ncbi:MAG TPA: hypothetical protein V6D19_08575, partial [Stenomitos sp.]